MLPLIKILWNYFTERFIVVYLNLNKYHSIYRDSE
jgi:hypothetical protein